MRLAEKYEALLVLLHYRPHPMRLVVLRTLCELTEFTDIHELSGRMQSSGVGMEKEKIRMILKRLNECDFLDRRGVTGQNKLLFRLREYGQLEQEVQNKLKNKHH